MSISYQSKDSLILGKQLAVQEVCIQFADVGLYSASGSVVTVNLQEAHTIVNVIHCDNSVPSAVLTAIASCVTTGTSVAITLANAFAANDSLKISYIVTE